MADGPLRRRAVTLTAVGLLSLSLLGSLVLMSAAMQNSARFGALYSVMLLSNSVGLIAFMGLIGINVRRLVRQLRARAPGARLTLRMLVIFVALAVLPVTVLYVFSLDFLKRGIDSWFDVRIGQALEGALELGRDALDLRMHDLLSQTETMAEEIAQGAPERTTLNLDALREPGNVVAASTWTPGAALLDAMRDRSGADELTLLGSDGQPLATSSRISEIIPHLPTEPVLNQVRQGRSYIALDPLRDGSLFVRVAVNVASGGGERRILHALFPMAPRINQLANSVEDAYAKYHELDYLRDKLKLSFVMTLTMVLLFSIVTAVWAAFYSARRLAAPIRDLATGTAAVAAGDYTMNLPVQSNDEMGFLVSSFNAMTRRIGEARIEVETQREYLDTLLRQLSSGVIALDDDACITTLNDSAALMLELGADALPGTAFLEFCRGHEHLQPLAEALTRLIAEHRQQWQEEVTLFASDGRRVLMCRGTALAGGGGGGQTHGYVIVFDNITAIIQGQRDAAWSEVARRLAHEIKNPLTPIQLAAERLRQKYLKRLSGEEGEALERLTSTIIQQVETMKAIVNTFSDYAKTPVISRSAVDINAVLAGVVELFRSAHPEARVDTHLAPVLPLLSGDIARLRQVFNNLVKNAFEASPEGANTHIIVSTSATHYAQADHVEIRIEDRGDGVPEELLQNIFEPYVSTKLRGTGLGLAIVKKIVEEHHGVVTLRNNPEGGAVIVIRLPLDKELGQITAALMKNAV